MKSFLRISFNLETVRKEQIGYLQSRRGAACICPRCPVGIRALAPRTVQIDQPKLELRVEMPILGGAPVPNRGLGYAVQNALTPRIEEPDQILCFSTTLSASLLPRLESLQIFLSFMVMATERQGVRQRANDERL